MDDLKGALGSRRSARNLFKADSRARAPCRRFVSVCRTSVCLHSADSADTVIVPSLGYHTRFVRRHCQHPTTDLSALLAYTYTVNLTQKAN